MQQPYVLITGGAGFIGTNVAIHYLERDEPVHIFDNLSRPGVERNISELRLRFPRRVSFTEGDVRSPEQLARVVQSARVIYHLAAQVAVTSSLEDPMADAAVNLGGTLNLLEAVRALPVRPPLLFTSTNKVYGGLYGLKLAEDSHRYRPLNSRVAEAGVDENWPLEFLSPYGCSKGSADQYVLDYARSYGLPATVFRMSCIYGPHQLGSEDQGWVAHFIRQTAKGESFTIFGDGKQVRDLLYVDDLVRAMHAAIAHMASASGQVFNIGGGFANSASLLEVLAQIRSLAARAPLAGYGPERIGDQRWYVSDTTKASHLLGWRPETTIREGLKHLMDWYAAHPELILQTDMQVA